MLLLNLVGVHFQALGTSPLKTQYATMVLFLMTIYGSHERNDFQAVELGSHECLLAFCEAVQRSSPVGSFTKPVAGTTPRYASEVIFADGTFIDGSTSELSCDGPLREPFAVYCQGGNQYRGF
uniref:Uncharacterized protein n=1 Tax=Fagus sylvatica TaxID=28930 RepID=A0A2N9ILI8_FAGSY